MDQKQRHAVVDVVWLRREVLASERSAREKHVADLREALQTEIKVTPADQNGNQAGMISAHMGPRWPTWAGPGPRRMRNHSGNKHVLKKTAQKPPDFIRIVFFYVNHIKQPCKIQKNSFVWNMFPTFFVFDSKIVPI